MMRRVISHEIGHALGLPHNMKASSAYPVDSLRSGDFTQKMGIATTIMDYARYNYVAQPGDENIRFVRQLGPYDDYAIEFGYRYFPNQTVALETAIRFMKETGCQAVKLEGGVRSAPQIEKIVDAGIPVMAHIGFTPQSEHGLGGHMIQGRGDGAEQLLADARAVEEAGAFAVVVEMVPSAIAGQVTSELSIPTISVGAGPLCDGQLMVWTDWAGFGSGRIPRFVKQYANLRETLLAATRTYREEVEAGIYPAAEHEYGG